MAPAAFLSHWYRPATIGLAVAGLAAAMTGGSPAGAASLAARSHGAPSTYPRLPATRSPVTWPFAATSPWNTPIGYHVTYNKSPDACTSDLRNTSDGSDLNTSQWSVPVYTAPRSARLITIWDNNISRGFAAQLNPGAKAAAPAGGDNDLTIVNGSKGVVDEMWRAQVNDAAARVTAADYARYSLYGSGIGKPLQGDNQGVRAYGGSAIAGLIRNGELQGGIHHALAFSQPRSMQRPGWVWPAIGQDSGGSGYAGHVPMGQLAFIPQSGFSGLGLSRYGLQIARALHYYGAYNVDSSGDFDFYAQPGVGVKIGQSSHDTIAYSDIPILRKLLVCVTDNGPKSIGGGGGYPKQLTPPPFGSPHTAATAATAAGAAGAASRPAVFSLAAALRVPGH